MDEARYLLVWPRDLFRWEARRIVELPDHFARKAVERLLEEAFHDPAVVDAFNAEMSRPPEVRALSTIGRAQAWLASLSGDDSRLLPYVPPRYYAEREGHTSAPSNPRNTLGMQFAVLLLDMRDNGYFPTALPRDCVDDPTDWFDVREKIRRALHMPFEWNGFPDEAAAWSEPLILSLIEYFHDHAQRPRVEAYLHEYNDCGPHYAQHSAESGAAVYRWRMNQLLDTQQTGLQLGRHGVERGRLIRRLGTPLDAAVDERAATGSHDPADEVAHAIRTYRERGASTTQKRSALALLAGALEQRRSEVKTVLRKDEQDLFRIANQFGIRHRRPDQQDDYGDEFLDYIFSAFVSAVVLMERLEHRSRSDVRKRSGPVPSDSRHRAG